MCRVGVCGGGHVAFLLGLKSAPTDANRIRGEFIFVEIRFEGSDFA
jgi:hypothetical protein